MLTLPQERSVRIAFIFGLFMVALGFFFFELYGTFLGLCEHDIVAWQLQQIKSHPEIKQMIERQSATPEQAADKAWERIKFLHGHGYVLVLAAFAFLMLIVNLPIVSAGLKAALMWTSLLSVEGGLSRWAR